MASPAGRTWKMSAFSRSFAAESMLFNVAVPEKFVIGRLAASSATIDALTAVPALACAGTLMRNELSVRGAVGIVDGGIATKVDARADMTAEGSPLSIVTLTVCVPAVANVTVNDA